MFQPLSSGIRPDAVRIDCRGVKIDCAVLNVEARRQVFQFVMDSDLRRTTTYHAGFFANGEALCDDALQYPESRRFCALCESPINVCYSHLKELKQRYATIFTHHDHLLAEGSPYKPLMFGTNWLSVRSDEDTAVALREHAEKSRLVSFMGSIQHDNTGAYGFRHEVAEFAMTQSDIDCYGKGIREISGKREALAPYRFSIAMENAASDFYFSEKLIDCVLLETIPLYYGCPGMDKLLDPRGLLQFSNLEELKQLHKELTPQRYTQMRPFALQNKQKIISKGWHSHLALFKRAAETLPANLGDSAPIAVRQANIAKRFLRRFLRR